MASSKLAKLDVVVFGATGDTGRCSCHYLFNNAKRLDITSWAPAARNLPKLQRLLPNVLSNDTPLPEQGLRPSEPIKADVNDYQSILQMVLFILLMNIHWNHIESLHQNVRALIP